MIFPDGSGSAHALPPNGERENMPNNKHKPFHKKRFTPDPSYVPPYDSAILALGIDFLKLGDEVAQKLTGAGISKYRQRQKHPAVKCGLLPAYYDGSNIFSY